MIMSGKSSLIPWGALLAALMWSAPPAGAATPRNPCAASPRAPSPGGGNPCAASPRVKASDAGNPCAARPRGGNPRAPRPSAAKNPCAAKPPAKAAENPGGGGGGKPFNPFADMAGEANPPQPARPRAGDARWGERRAGVPQPRYFFTQRPDASARDAVARGRLAFRRAGCVGCHPRGRTIYGHAVTAAGARHPFPIPTLIDAAEHFPRLGPTGRLLSVGQFNDFCAATFLGEPPMDPYSQKFKDLEAYVISLSPARYKRMLAWEAKRKALIEGRASGAGGAPTAAPSEGEAAPARAARTPGEGGNPGGGEGGNPCAPRRPRPPNPGDAGNPCAPGNPPALKNPCARPAGRK